MPSSSSRRRCYGCPTRLAIKRRWAPTSRGCCLRAQFVESFLTVANGTQPMDVGAAVAVYGVAGIFCCWRPGLRYRDSSVRRPSHVAGHSVGDRCDPDARRCAASARNPALCGHSRRPRHRLARLCAVDWPQGQVVGRGPVEPRRGCPVTSNPRRAAAAVAPVLGRVAEEPLLSADTITSRKDARNVRNLASNSEDVERSAVEWRRLYGPALRYSCRCWLLSAAGIGIGPDPPRDVRHLYSPIPIVLHVVSAAVYALFGAFQFVTAVRRRFPAWHRSPVASCWRVRSLPGFPRRG